jgi:hypothetical protein
MDSCPTGIGFLHHQEWLPALPGMASHPNRNGFPCPQEWLPAPSGMASHTFRNSFLHRRECLPVLPGMAYDSHRNGFLTLLQRPRGHLKIIRNKLVSRVFAAINRQEPYLDLYKYAA